jgi:hypothetical protein
MNKIKRIVQMNMNIHFQNINVVIDSFYDDVENLESKEKTIVLLIVKNQSDYLIKRFSS